jgi:hypothetical protein
MENKSIYDKLKTPPKEALKSINAGRLKGKTDISPQWRIQAMTEQFGICGIGWKYVITKQWTEPGDNGQMFAFVNIDLYVKHEDKWSDPIPGTGGTIIVIKEKNGMYSDDDAFKKSVTDALGFAMKFLGMGADVYMGKMDGGNPDSKYNNQRQQASNKQDNFEARELTVKEVEEKWNGKIYKGSVYVDDKRVVPSKEQIEKLRNHKKYIEG